MRRWVTATNRFVLIDAYKPRAEDRWNAALFAVATSACTYVDVTCSEESLELLAAIHCGGQLAAMAAVGVTP